jgi:hypothetical protein
MMNLTIINHNGYDVECYGDIEEDSNFAVVCEDEDFDVIWCEGNPVTGEPFTHWNEVVTMLQSVIKNPILEIGVC